MTAANDDAKNAKQLKTDITAAKTAIKNATDMEKNDNNAQRKLNALEKSEQTIGNYLSQEEYKERKDLHLLLIDLIRKQYEAGNEKMYLKQKVDTAWYVKTGRRMFLAIKTFDSIDAKPNDKGVAEPSYRKRHSEYLAPYRVNIMKGGLYFMRHREWAEAWQCLDMYLDSRIWPLFQDTAPDTIDTKRVAYMAMRAACELQDLDKARKYSKEALSNTTLNERGLTMLSNLSLAKKDSTLYIEYITKGFEKYPKSEYFFPRLIDYYTNKGDYESSEKYVDQALEKDSTNHLFMLAKHSLLMSTEKYDDALRYAYRLIQDNDTLPILNYNVGFIYYQKAQQALKQTGKPYRTRMKEAQKYYKFLLPYMEKYRKSAPDDRARWHGILYDAYLNLNMGKEFNALEKE
jgi:hypothetical protein